jgi:alpha-glucosidase
MAGRGFGFSAGADPEPCWLPQPPDWGRYSVEAQLADEGSFLRLYRAALRLRRDHPALGRGELSWRGEPEAAGLLCFDREPGFIFAANLGPGPRPVPPHRELLLASGPLPDGSLPPDTAVWLSA